MQSTMLPRNAVAVATALAFFAMPLAAQTTVELAPLKDNTLYEDASGQLSNGSGRFFFAGRTDQAEGSRRRALLAFDIAAALPAGARIEQVRLRLNMSKTNDLAGAHDISLHRASSDWGEGASVAPGEEGAGGTAAQGDATWIHTFFNTSQWGTAGGDFVAQPSATVSVDNVGAYTWGSTEALVADVQAWLDNPEQNFGWILIGNEEARLSAKRFDSRENSVAANRPVLEVQYTEPTPVADAGSLPQQFSLQQSYPNPVRLDQLRSSGNVIRFALAQPAPVSIAIYNILGQKIATLSEQQLLAAGQHSIRWNGRDGSGRAVPQGVYFYRLQAGDQIQSQRLTVLR